MKDLKELKESLDLGLNNCEKVIILPHIKPDFDAIASAIGLSCIAKKAKKDAFIIIDEPEYKLFHGVQEIYKEALSDHKFITKDEYNLIKSEKDLFILTDVNGRNRIPLKEEIIDENTIIIDHHDLNVDTIKAYYTYIDTSVSSSSEVITLLAKTRFNCNTANYLMSGIYLDTKHFTKKFKKETSNAVNKLMDMGADMDKVTQWFIEDYYSDKKVSDLINKVEFITYVIALVEGNQDIEYTREELARAADYVLNSRCHETATDASFIIGNIGENTTGISARSNSRIDVGEIMRKIDGGGNSTTGATQLESLTTEQAGKKLIKIIKPEYLND